MPLTQALNKEQPETSIFSNETPPATLCLDLLFVSKTLYEAKKELMNIPNSYWPVWGVCKNHHPTRIINGCVVCADPNCTDPGHYEQREYDVNQN